jgi:hypothetical protein
MPGLDDADKIIEAAFSVRKTGGGAVASGRQAHYLVVLKEIRSPEEKDLEEMRSAIKGALRFQREQEVLNGYLQEIQEVLKDRIKINEKLL